MERSKKVLDYYSEKNFIIQKNKRNYPSSMKSYHYHNNFEIYYLCSGERYYFIKDENYHIKKGTLVLINEFDIHCTRNVENLWHERIVLNFDKEFLEEISDKLNINLFECFEKNINIIELDLYEQNYIENLLNNMYVEYTDKKENYNIYLKAATIQLLIFANRYKKNKQSEINDLSTAPNKMITKIIAHINNNYADEISLTSIAEQFFISPYYFSRTFKKVTNLSFVDYLNNVRIKEAQELLKKTDLSITIIGEKVGFKSTTHFGRTFKKITGISPFEYKKKSR